MSIQFMGVQGNSIEAHVGGFYLQGGVGNLAATDFATIHVPDEDIELARSLRPKGSESFEI